ncbi:hypothetical protein [Methylobacterium sp. A54F]
MQDVAQDDWERPAYLTLWSAEPNAPKAVEPKPCPTLREALAEASAAMQAGLVAWILTDSGLILSPTWLRGYQAAAERREAS